jgi:hypothetical protein
MAAKRSAILGSLVGLAAIFVLLRLDFDSLSDFVYSAMCVLGGTLSGWVVGAALVEGDASAAD